MAYTALKLITQAYQLSQVNPRELQTITGPQSVSGLQWLNEIISNKSVRTRMIPYYQQYTFNATPNQESYFIPGLIQVETMTFNLGDVRFPMTMTNRDFYFGSARVDNISALPFNWRLERGISDEGIEGATLYMYFLPNQNYPIKIWCKFALTQAPNLEYDLSLNYPKYYLKYLRYALADSICDEYAMTLHPSIEAKLLQLEKDILDISAPDLTLSKISPFGSDISYTWADANLGKGWRPLPGY